MLDRTRFCKPLPTEEVALGFAHKPHSFDVATPTDQEQPSIDGCTPTSSITALEDCQSLRDVS